MEKNKKRKPFKLRKNESRFLLVAFVWCLIISFGFLLLLRVFNPNKSIEDLGTSFNGFVGVFVAFFGSILVYKALQSQIEANRIIQKQFKNQKKEQLIIDRFNYFKNSIDIIYQEINNFKFDKYNELSRGPKVLENYIGTQALKKLFIDTRNKKHDIKIKSIYLFQPKLYELKSILIFMYETTNSICHDSLITASNKLELINFIEFVFESKLNTIFESNKEYQRQHHNICPCCDGYHHIPSELFDIVLKIKTLLKEFEAFS